MTVWPQRKKLDGFSLLELLAVIATISILASLLLPILSKAKIRAQQTQCVSNLHQLGLGWVMYYNDNGGRLVESYPVNNPNAWILGDMSNPSDATNLDLIRLGKLFHYNQSVEIYHCPADQGVTIGGKHVQNVRSYSMNAYMGERNPNVGYIPNFASQYVQYYAKDSDIRRPSSLFVLLDEDERSINDGFFVPDPTAHIWIDFPANSRHRHNYGYAINFADGHSETWHYHDPRSKQVAHAKTEQPGNHDLERLAGASATVK
jgi:prepilin-type N-terminal cleavage/methylation domain-containing protein